MWYYWLQILTRKNFYGGLVHIRVVYFEENIAKFATKQNKTKNKYIFWRCPKMQIEGLSV